MIEDFAISGMALAFIDGSKKPEVSVMKSSILVRALPFAALAATAGFATTAQAHVVEWAYSVSSAFTGATFNVGTFTDTDTSDPTKISWSDNDGDTSEIGVVSTPTGGTVFTNGTFAAADDYYHQNNVLDLGTTFLDTATLTISIDLTAVDPAGDPLAPALSRDFNISFIETLNAGSGGICADGGAHGVGINANGCADIFVLEFDFGQFDFQYDIGDGSGLQDYTLFIFEDPSDPNAPQLGFLSDEACASAGVAAGCFGFLTMENVTTIAQFAISIEHRDIPEPAMLGLFGLGLIGLGAARRRKA